jgi:hypothetical protein
MKRYSIQRKYDRTFSEDWLLEFEGFSKSVILRELDRLRQKNPSKEFRLVDETGKVIA